MPKITSAKQIAELTDAMMDPLLAKRAGINVALLAAWDEIVGPDFADASRPDQIKWDRGRNADAETGGGFSAGTLVIACEGSRALFLSHTEREIIQRINAFFGFHAIARIKIVQKSVSNLQGDKRQEQRAMTSSEQRRLADLLSDVEDGNLRDALARLGKGVLTKNTPK